MKTKLSFLWTIGNIVALYPALSLIPTKVLPYLVRLLSKQQLFWTWPQLDTFMPFLNCAPLRVTGQHLTRYRQWEVMATDLDGYQLHLCVLAFWVKVLGGLVWVTLKHLLFTQFIVSEKFGNVEHNQEAVQHLRCNCLFLFNSVAIHCAYSNKHLCNFSSQKESYLYAAEFPIWGFDIGSHFAAIIVGLNVNRNKKGSFPYQFLIWRW